MDIEAPSGFQKKPASPWKIIAGVVLLLGAAGNSVKPIPPEAGTAGALGALTGVTILVCGGAALIGWGMPKTLGTVDFQRRRRRLWYRMLLTGFLAMMVSAGILAWLSFVGAGIAVTWIYWFGWTWISWRIADKQARYDVEPTRR